MESVRAGISHCMFPQPGDGVAQRGGVPLGHQLNDSGFPLRPPLLNSCMTCHDANIHGSDSLSLPLEVIAAYFTRTHARAHGHTLLVNPFHSHTV